MNIYNKLKNIIVYFIIITIILTVLILSIGTAFAVNNVNYSIRIKDVEYLNGGFLKYSVEAKLYKTSKATPIDRIRFLTYINGRRHVNNNGDPVVKLIENIDGQNETVTINLDSNVVSITDKPNKSDYSNLLDIDNEEVQLCVDIVPQDSEINTYVFPNSPSASADCLMIKINNSTNQIDAMKFKDTNSIFKMNIIPEAQEKTLVENFSGGVSIPLVGKPDIHEIETNLGESGFKRQLDKSRYQFESESKNKQYVRDEIMNGRRGDSLTKVLQDNIKEFDKNNINGLVLDKIFGNPIIKDSVTNINQLSTHVVTLESNFSKKTKYVDGINPLCDSVVNCYYLTDDRYDSTLDKTIKTYPSKIILKSYLDYDVNVDKESQDFVTGTDSVGKYKSESRNVQKNLKAIINKPVELTKYYVSPLNSLYDGGTVSITGNCEYIKGGDRKECEDKEKELKSKLNKEIKNIRLQMTFRDFPNVGVVDLSDKTQFTSLGCNPLVRTILYKTVSKKEGNETKIKIEETVEAYCKPQFILVTPNGKRVKVKNKLIIGGENENNVVMRYNREQKPKQLKRGEGYYVLGVTTLATDYRGTFSLNNYLRIPRGRKSFAKYKFPILSRPTINTNEAYVLKQGNSINSDNYININVNDTNVEPPVRSLISRYTIRHGTTVNGIKDSINYLDNSGINAILRKNVTEGKMDSNETTYAEAAQPLVIINDYYEADKVLVNGKKYIYPYPLEVWNRVDMFRTDRDGNPLSKSGYKLPNFTEDTYIKTMYSAKRYNIYLSNNIYRDYYVMPYKVTTDNMDRSKGDWKRYNIDDPDGNYFKGELDLDKEIEKFDLKHK